MKRALTTTIIFLVLSVCALGQSRSAPDELPDQPMPPVKIIHGPVVELIGDSMAQVAWSTNVNAGTLVRYGTDPKELNQTAGMPWGGLTHRVVLKRLHPDTTYYFKVESAQGQDTGTRDESQQSSFKTVLEGEPPILNRQPR